MGNLLEDYFAEFKFFQQSYTRLREVNPRHRYHRLVRVTETGEILPKYKFWRIFETPECLPNLEKDLRYQVAVLLRANKKLQQAIREAS